MYHHAPLVYRFPTEYFPLGIDSNSSFEKLLPSARGWHGNFWLYGHEPESEGKIAIVHCAPRHADCEPAPSNLRAMDGNATTEVSEYFFRLQSHFLAKFGEQGAVIRAHMLFQAYGPIRNLDPKQLFSEDADGDPWSGAIDTLKS